MDRKFLEELGLEKEAIDSIMKEHGKSIQAVKPAEDYEELKKEKTTLEKEVTQLRNTLSTKENEFSSYENNLNEVKSELEKYKVKDLKTSIAVQAGIPIDLAERLAGETEEEIKADAEKLSGFVNTGNPILPLKDTEPEDVDEGTKAYKDLLNGLDLKND